MPKGSAELTASRKKEIIEACEKLYQTMSFKEITLKEIGNATSFTRTSIYNYFQTKEEIFLALLEKEYLSWIEELNALKNEKQPNKDKLAKGISKSLENHQMMLKILSMNHYDMEENSRQENLNEFKTVYGKTLETMDDLLKYYCPNMDESNRQSFIYAFFPFLYGIYPYTFVTDKQNKAIKISKTKFVHFSVYDLVYSFVKELLRVGD